MEGKKLDLDNFDIEGKVPVDSILYVRPDKPLNSLDEALKELQDLTLEILNESQVDNVLRICNYLETHSCIIKSEDGPVIKEEGEMAEFWPKAKEATINFLFSLIEDTKPEAKILDYNICNSLIMLFDHQIFKQLVKGQEPKLDHLRDCMKESRKIFLKEIEVSIEKNKREMKIAKRKKKDARDSAKLKALKEKFNRDEKKEKVEYDPVDNELVY